MKIQQAREFALSLPAVTEVPHHAMSSFRVAGKIFATVPPDGLHLHVFVDEEEREQAIAIAPKAFEKLFWGARVAGVRVLLSAARVAQIQGLLHSAWQRKAPKGLAGPIGA